MASELVPYYFAKVAFSKNYIDETCFFRFFQNFLFFSVEKFRQLQSVITLDGDVVES